MKNLVSDKNMLKKQELIFISGERKVFQIDHVIKRSQSGAIYDISVHAVGSFFKYADGRIEFTKSFQRSSKVARFSLVAKHTQKTLSFGPSDQLGMLPVELQNHGIGRYCMTQLILEFAAQFPEYSIASGNLSVVDARDDFSRDNRNGFYKNMGFRLDLSEDGRYGHFACDEVSQLATKWNRKKVRKLSLELLNTKLVDSYKDKNKIKELNRVINTINKTSRVNSSQLMKRNIQLIWSLILNVALIVLVMKVL